MLDFEIILEKFTVEDFVHYFELVNDKRVMAMITERAIELEEAKADYANIITNNCLHSYLGSFKIINNHNGAFMGFAKLEIKLQDDKEAEIGYMILPKYWGQGIAGKVCKLLIDTAIQQTQIARIVAIIDPNNAPSRKVLINNSFESEEFKDFDGLPGEVLALNIR